MYVLFDQKSQKCISCFGLPTYYRGTVLKFRSINEAMYYLQHIRINRPEMAHLQVVSMTMVDDILTDAMEGW